MGEISNPGELIIKEEELKIGEDTMKEYLRKLREKGER